MNNPFFVHNLYTSANTFSSTNEVKPNPSILPDRYNSVTHPIIEIFDSRTPIALINEKKPPYL